ncbi:MAG: TlpA family protein disulfide reductase [Deltaproteobacteria bacterium]|nr:TlpA family protein disulfide reductase [Deltaproteobacteria bacterium]
MKTSVRFLILAGLILSLVIWGQARAQEKPLIQAGDTFPEVTMPAPRAAGDKAYLGLGTAPDFTLNQVSADVILVELLSVYCYSCQKQAPIFNKLYELIEGDPKARGRIKLLGIAVGSEDLEIDEFRREYKVTFPIIQDPEFEIYHELGGTRTPFSMFVRKGPSSKEILVASTHMGFDMEYKKLLEQLVRLADTDISSLSAQLKKPEAAAEKVEPVLAGPELEAKVAALMEEALGRQVQPEKLGLESGRTVYTATSGEGKEARRMFAEVVAREVPCDMCHAVHFIYVFDPSGKVILFQALQLTKHGNEPMTADEVAKLRRHVVGSAMNGRLHFDVKVDAVAQATITSAVVYDSLSNGPALLEELKQKGLIR